MDSHAGNHTERPEDSASEFFRYAARAARAQFDPIEQWDEFVAALWHQVDVGFALTENSENAAPPDGAWFEYPNDSPGLSRDEC